MDIRRRQCLKGPHKKDSAIVMCKEKATGLRLRVKAEVIQTRDDPSDVSEITDVSNLTVPRI